MKTHVKSFYENAFLKRDIRGMKLIPNELVSLVDYCHSLANLLLIEQGEFYPFGVYLSNEQKITQRLFHDGDDFPLSTGLINIIKHDFDQQLAIKAIAASAVVYDAKVTNESYPEAADVVVVRLASQTLDVILLYYLPYQSNEDKIEYGIGWIETGV